MKTVSAREANQAFSQLLNAAAGGERVVITRRGRPVAVLAPYSCASDDAAHEAAVERIVALMRRGLPLGGRRFSRDEMHER